MAAPMRCTSLAPICFSTSAASRSPRVNSKMAARSVPERSDLSVIIGHPALDDLSDTLRVLCYQGPGLCHLLFVSECGLLRRAGECRCIRCVLGARAQLGWATRGRRLWGEPG